MFNQFEDRVQQPTYKHKIEIYSDGNEDYTSVLPEYYNEDCLCYGQKVKTQNGKTVFPAIKRAVYGNPNLWEIDTNTNESFNSILRGKLSRLVRRTKDCSKNKSALEDSLWMFQFYWNFMHQLHKKVTPAILEKKATKIWTWGNFLHAKLTVAD